MEETNFLQAQAEQMKSLFTREGGQKRSNMKAPVDTLKFHHWPIQQENTEQIVRTEHNEVFRHKSFGLHITRNLADRGQQWLDCVGLDGTFLKLLFDPPHRTFQFHRQVQRVGILSAIVMQGLLALARSRTSLIVTTSCAFRVWLAILAFSRSLLSSHSRRAATDNVVRRLCCC